MPKPTETTIETTTTETEKSIVDQTIEKMWPSSQETTLPKADFIAVIAMTCFSYLTFV